LPCQQGEDVTSAKDKGVIREIISEGENYTTPNEGAQVTVEIEGKYQGKVFDESRTISYVVGEGRREILLYSKRAEGNFGKRLSGLFVCDASYAGRQCNRN